MPVSADETYKFDHDKGRGVTLEFIRWESALNTPAEHLDESMNLLNWFLFSERNGADVELVTRYLSCGAEGSHALLKEITRSGAI